MNEITITVATVGDHEILRQIAEDTFTETYAGLNAKEDMERYIKMNFSVEKVKEELANVNSQFFLAFDSEGVIGYLKVNTGEAQTALQDPSALEIERIYVRARYHGKNVGKLFYEKAVTVARQMDKKSIWLGVWEHNPKAIRFYEKNGFVTFDTHLFTLGKEEQTDLMMRKALL